jgi:uncharacterized membrane protein
MKALRIASAVVAVIGLGIAVYLTIVHYTGSSPVCAISHGCETVQTSRYAELAGIPVAVLGCSDTPGSSSRCCATTRPRARPPHWCR